MPLVSSRMRSSDIAASPSLLSWRCLWSARMAGRAAPIKNAERSNYPFNSRRQLHPLVPVVLQLVTQHLAAVAFRQFGNDEHLLGNFRRRQACPAVVDHGGFAQAVAGLSHHVAHDLLAVDRVRHADRGGIEHVGMLE